MADGSGITVRGTQVLFTESLFIPKGFACGSNDASPDVGDRMGYGYYLAGNEAFGDYYYTLWHGPIYAQSSIITIVNQTLYDLPTRRLAVTWNQSGRSYFWYYE